MTGSLPETTIDLISKLKAGDTGARDKLVEKSVPPLQRWARGRLPRWARSLGDTQDLVHDVILRALPRLTTFEPSAPGALQAFLRRAVRNRIVDEVRRARSFQMPDEIAESRADPSPSPLEEAIRREGMARYRSALGTLEAIDCAIVEARIERQQSYADIADAFGKPTTDAARMAVNRALAKLLKAMAGRR